jgi:hypothetical protein
MNAAIFMLVVLSYRFQIRIRFLPRLLQLEDIDGCDYDHRHDWAFAYRV